MDHVHMPDPIAERFKVLEARIEGLKRRPERETPHREDEPRLDQADQGEQGGDVTTVAALTTRMDDLGSELKELRRQIQAANRKMNVPVAKKASLTRKRRAAAHHRPHDPEA